MPSRAPGGIEGFGETLGPPGLGVLALHNFQQAATLMARRMPFITCVVPVVSLSYERWKKNNPDGTNKNFRYEKYPQSP